MRSAAPVIKDLVLVGGGHAHVLVLKRFGMQPLPGVRLTLVAKDLEAPYSGMLPGLVSGHYGHDECHIDLQRLARFAGARLYHDSAVGLDLAAAEVRCAGRPPVRFDLISIDIGSQPARNDVPGAALYATPVKPIDGLVTRWELLLKRVLERGASRVAVVGAGAAGVELALAVQFRLQSELRATGGDAGAVSVALVTQAEILPGYPPAARRMLQRILGERAIEVYSRHQVVEVRQGLLICANGADIPADDILWVTQAAAAPWLHASGLDCGPGGFVNVHDTLQSLSDPRVFAAGDVANVLGYPRPKAGVFAVRQGKALAENLRRVLLGKAPRRFHPQKAFLSLISTGNRYAVASRWGLAAEGAAIWQLKDWIDRRFMRQFDELPLMESAETAAIPSAADADADAIKELSALAMRCGGCGAKVGHTVLSRVIGRLNPIASSDVLLGLNAPDDAAVVRVPQGKVMVHTVDFFRTMIDDPFIFGQIAANHSLGDIFAMGAEPQTALAMATVPYGLEAKMEDDLFQMMSGAVRVLDDAGAALVGGHTSEGAELGLGFAVNGTAAEHELLRKGPLQPGHVLILTKAIGTGVLFAADMRHRAKGRWIEDAVRSMLLSSREAARILRASGALACTDVTGFGLVGHLVEMIRQSDADVVIDLDAIPLLDGALATVSAGIFSSLQPQNLRLRRAIGNHEAVAGDVRLPLLFDPQTAGGLLAAVPADAAGRCVQLLQEAGYPAVAMIGRVVRGTGTVGAITVNR